MKSKLSLLALGLGAYLAFVLVSFPASVAHRWFAPDALQLAAVDGTIWRGSAAYGGVGGLAFSNLRWQLHPAALLTGTVSVTAEARLADGFVSASVDATANRVEMSGVRAATSLATLRDAIGFGDVSGQISVELQSLELVDGWPVAAVGEARVRDLAAPPLMPVSGMSTIALGHYLARFTAGDEPGIVAALADEGGPLELTGRLSVMPDRSYLFDALIRPRADAPDALVQGLDFVAGEPNANGQRKLVQSGTL